MAVAATAVLLPSRTLRDVSTDAVLLARVQAGDERALSALFDEHGGMVHGVARRVTGDEQLARDVTQDVFVYLWERPDRVDLERGSVRSFLGIVTHRRAVDAVRTAVRHRRAEAAAFDHTPLAAAFDDDVACTDALSWCRDRLTAALDQLPEEQRDALVLAYYAGRTYKDVAIALGIPEGTAKSRIRLGLARLRALVGDELQAER